MKTYLFSEMIWSKEKLLFEDGQSYNLRHLFVEPVDSIVPSDRREYSFKFNPSGDVIFRIIVQSEVEDFKHFHNAMIKSKINGLIN